DAIQTSRHLLRRVDRGVPVGLEAGQQDRTHRTSTARIRYAFETTRAASSRRLPEPERGQPGPAAHAELPEQSRDVRMGRGERERQVGRDLLLGAVCEVKAHDEA